MPYITDKRRMQVDSAINELVGELLMTDIIGRGGTLNYIITRLMIEGWDLKDDPRYSKFEQVTGTLECAKAELYRRHVAPYEDIKIKENGDV